MENKNTIAYHKAEIKKWKSADVQYRFTQVGSDLPAHAINDHTVAINQLRNLKKCKK